MFKVATKETTTLH